MNTDLTGGGVSVPAFMSRPRARRRARRAAAAAGAVIMASVAMAALPARPAARASCANPVACENALPGTPQSVWDVGKGEGKTIQGFADPFSVNVGGSISFKIQSPATAYAIDIYRMGYYGGNGARLQASITPNISVSQSQPACASDAASGLIDCGNWGISATWNVPATAVSGVYFAHIHRTDGTTDENQIPFVVTSSASHSDVVFMTSDETWQAYNDWGGNSLYAGNATVTARSPLNPHRAVQVSYNRPFATRFDTPGGQDFFFATEFPMVQFLEKNGYDVSYVSQQDVAGTGAPAMLEQHKAFVNAGHSEYWDAAGRANLTAARDAGLNLAFFAGNLMWWKTRWASSQFGSEPNRTLVTYKESLDSAQTDPSDPPTWTGTWRDPRFSPPGDGGQPENALTGQLWMVNCCSSALQVPSEYANLRFWRNTSVASLTAGQTATMPAETLGYEWDIDVDNGFRPAGQIDMSKTTANVQQFLLTPNEQFGGGSATHSLTLYRAASGALIFDAGTVQWSWGLAFNHDGIRNAPSPAMQQATVNLLADMGAQPATLDPALTAATASADHTPPASAITSPSAGATFTGGTAVTVSGTATDAGGGVVAGVEVSADGGSTWHPVTTMSPATASVTWSYTWSVAGNGPVTIMSRATDDSGNIETPGPGVGVTVGCPCSLFGANYIPAVTSTSDATPVEVGVKFQSSVPGWVAGVRFYKGAGNTGTHIGSLWTPAGSLLANGAFSHETDSGWQTLLFASPVQVSANTTYVVSYYAPYGHYSADLDLLDVPLNTPPLTAPAAAYTGTGGGNGVFYIGGHGFPSSTFHGSSYGVDVIFATTQPSGTPPTVTSVAPFPGSSSNPVSTAPTATFSKPVVPATASFTVTDPGGTAVAGTTTFDSTGTIATFAPANPLAAQTTYTAVISGAQDAFGQSMSPSSFTWSFTTSKASAPGQCPCSIWPDVTPASAADAADAAGVQVGVRFKAAVNGTVSGVRFFKEADNTGTHTGNLWSAAGTLLATGTFSGESTQGWQELNFATPVAITAGTAYVVSYFASAGHYAVTPGGLSSAVTSGALTAQAGGGVYSYGTASTFPTHAFNRSNYWVDVLYTPAADPAAPAVTATSPLNGQTSVPTGTTVSFTFSKPVLAETIQFALTGPGAAAVPGALSYSPATNSATFTPTSTGSPALAPGTVYTATVSGAANVSGTPMAGPYAWTFTTAQAPPPPGQCPCSTWPDSTQPSMPSASDASAVNVGVKFTSDSNGWITGLRFYKGAANTGTHVGSLWSASGTLLGQVTFASESTAGWQQASFSPPIAITSGTTYVASYLAPKGGYAITAGAFTSAGADSPPLHALHTGVSGGNGVYLYRSTPAFPTATFNASNYWVDVVFTTTSP